MNIHEDYIGRRIDKYLRDCFGYLQSKICVLAKQHKILVNNTPVKFDYRLQKKDTINILDDYFQKQKNNLKQSCLIYDKNDKKNSRKDKKCNQQDTKSLQENKGKTIRNNTKIQAQNQYISRQNNSENDRRTKQDLPIEMIYKLKNAIVFEDDNVLVINKPYGISVQGGTGVKYCLEDFFSILCDKKLRIVHRIDKDTRGLLVLAKNVPTAAKLTEMFKKREVHKTYLAVLSGIPLKNSGTIKTHIFLSNETNLAYNARNSEERYNGKEAITKYKVLKTNKQENLALVEFHPLTGRKHQIRLHAQHIKCPIVGDEKYSFGKQKNKKLQLFAIAIDASPIVKLELTERDFPDMMKV